MCGPDDPGKLGSGGASDVVELCSQPLDATHECLERCHANSARLDARGDSERRRFLSSFSRVLYG